MDSIIYNLTHISYTRKTVIDLTCTSVKQNQISSNDFGYQSNIIHLKKL